MSAKDIERALRQGAELCREIERFQRRVGGAMHLAGEGLEVPDHLNEAISDGCRALNSDIYYFRKHAAQVDPSQQAAEVTELRAQLEEERARNAAMQPAFFRYVLVSRPGWAAVRKGPLADGKHVEQMLRELYALHPDATCLVIDMPDASYPDDGREWIAMFGDQRRKRIPPTLPLAILPEDTGKRE